MGYPDEEISREASWLRRAKGGAAGRRTLKAKPPCRGLNCREPAI
jgi:hypothetical protein